MEGFGWMIAVRDFGFLVGVRVSGFGFRVLCSWLSLYSSRAYWWVGSCYASEMRISHHCSVFSTFSALAFCSYVCNSSDFQG